jgi:hypothetical protein
MQESIVMRNVTRKFATVVAVVVALAIPTIARAHGTVPFSNTNVIHACRSASGILRQITSGSCVGNEVAVHWDITSPGSPRADGPCADNANRYVDCGNGTVTDTATGLIWLQQSDCLPFATYSGATQVAAGLKAGDCGLTDKSSPGDWRLPTFDEWRTTFVGALSLGCTAFGPGTGPSLTNDAGTACLSDGPSSFTGVWTFYWSSSSLLPDPSLAIVALLDTGRFFTGEKVNSYAVWPVRGGPR